ncbi:uncharacterized protein LOC128881862 [Hylaeus volcanicus]|uniref:uncharacterized protein LOC128881862 n=1 Tax=Hylaeus volcanicus TaxID=313075 RepID=UPI0023B7766B|nr:uncharacterized protein LOC128881862 [Hylaeus volcanicus]
MEQNEKKPFCCLDVESLIEFGFFRLSTLAYGGGGPLDIDLSSMRSLYGGVSIFLALSFDPAIANRSAFTQEKKQLDKKQLQQEQTTVVYSAPKMCIQDFADLFIAKLLSKASTRMENLSYGVLIGQLSCRKRNSLIRNSSNKNKRLSPTLL